MNIKQMVACSIMTTVILTGSSIVFAADTAKEAGNNAESGKTSSIKKTVGESNLP